MHVLPDEPYIGAPIEERPMGLPAAGEQPPVAGYKPLTQLKLDLVNENKAMEERVLRRLDDLALMGETVDRRWLAVGRTHIEQAFMAINRSVFQPGRVALPEDVS